MTPNMSSVLTTVASTVGRTMTGMVNTTNHTLNALQNISTTAKTREITHAKEDGIMSQRRYFMHFVSQNSLLNTKSAMILRSILRLSQQSSKFEMQASLVPFKHWLKYQQLFSLVLSSKYNQY